MYLITTAKSPLVNLSFNSLVTFSPPPVKVTLFFSKTGVSSVAEDGSLTVVSTVRGCTVTSEELPDLGVLPKSESLVQQVAPTLVLILQKFQSPKLQLS